mmetsp:Transcript_22014/g.61896  ORF Transcript_22014/g.61896 Transcript_22014/m.61896 type:complete len:1185 (-) Transcript_22014:55-3609(-)|eukprot:CAMPEP_0119152992 /NCGR_PEP_ID=MMETSP1310-20130426/48547_1 /TAXON_ID=464262 /ORGANISM="Genus nov. species nov., Strain RCC2339" /LENGTH=1184 /DNA_ID=CAMNT_0007145405 /DNA_START=169 /DNA_END=3723 /DNA_ORIENTATION=+
MDFFLKRVRTKVSGDKQRYKEGEYDLDFTYITDRMIAMAFPGEGIESTYRNNIDEVAEVLKSKHGHNYMIYNLSERHYDYTKFDRKVMTWCGFPDHCPPSLALLFRIVHSIHTWTMNDERNVTVAHCKAGHGRTGTVICAYFLYTGLFDTMADACNYFGSQRSVNNWGVTGPSQLRYISYFDSILHGRRYPSRKWCLLSRVVMHHAPAFVQSNKPFVEVYKVDEGKDLLFSSERFGSDASGSTFTREEEVPGEAGVSLSFIVNVPVLADLLVVFLQKTHLGATEKVCHLVFHSGMVEGNTIVFKKFQIDKANKDVRFPPLFSLVFEFSPLGPQQQHEMNQRFFATCSPDAQKAEETLYKTIPEKRDGRGNYIADSGVTVAEKYKWARDLAVPHTGLLTEKGGFLYKRSHQDLKVWKRRWFALHPDELVWMNTPRDTRNENMVLPLASVVMVDVRPMDCGDNNLGLGTQSVLLLLTKRETYYITSDDEQDLSLWYLAVSHATSNAHGNKDGKKEGTVAPEAKVVCTLAQLRATPREGVLAGGSVASTPERHLSPPRAPVRASSASSLHPLPENRQYYCMVTCRGDGMEATDDRKVSSLVSGLTTQFCDSFTVPVFPGSTSLLVELYEQKKDEDAEESPKKPMLSQATHRTTTTRRALEQKGDFYRGTAVIPVAAIPSGENSPLSEQWYRLHCMCRKTVTHFPKQLSDLQMKRLDPSGAALRDSRPRPASDLDLSQQQSFCAESSQSGAGRIVSTTDHLVQKSLVTFANLRRFAGEREEAQVPGKVSTCMFCEDFSFDIRLGLHIRKVSSTEKWREEVLSSGSASEFRAAVEAAEKEAAAVGGSPYENVAANVEMKDVIQREVTLGPLTRTRCTVAVFGGDKARLGSARLLLVRSKGGARAVWLIDGSCRLYELPESGDRVEYCVSLADGETLLSAMTVGSRAAWISHTGGTVVLDTETLCPLANFSNRIKYFCSGRRSNGGDILVCGVQVVDDASSLIVWDARTYAHVAKRTLEEDAVSCLCQVGDYLWVGTQEGIISSYAMQTLIRGDSWKVGKGALVGIHYDAYNKFVWTSSSDGGQSCWSIEGKLLREVSSGGGRMDGPTFKVELNRHSYSNTQTSIWSAGGDSLTYTSSEDGTSCIVPCDSRPLDLAQDSESERVYMIGQLGSKRLEISLWEGKSNSEYNL